jgi:uncharacterized alkaline shock family protein YloU
MGDNLPLSVQLDDNPNGTVSFASDVVATMAGLAATEIEGVFSMYSQASGFGNIFNRRNQNTKGNHTKGVKVEVEDGKISVDISIVVDYGTPVPTIAREIQENVKKTVETMSGLEVSHVDEGLPTEFWYAEIEFPDEKTARAWQPCADGLSEYLCEEVSEQPGSSMGEYWEETRVRAGL